MYLETLQATKTLWNPTPLFTPALKHQALRRLEEDPPFKTSVFLAAFVVMLTTAAIFSILAPIWLLSEALSFVVESTPIRIGLALFVAHCLGGTAVGLWAVPLAKKAALARTSTGGVP
jgi:hypothetical protein